MYDSVDDAKQKLVESTVVFDGVPVYIYGAHTRNRKIVLSYAKLPLDSMKSPPIMEEEISDPRWDFRTIGSKLGYVNVTKSPFDGKIEAVFTTRIPTRHSRQGLDERTTRTSQCLENIHPWGWGNIIYQQGIVNTFTNTYPTVKEAVDLLTNDPLGIKSVAISRKLALIFDRINPPNLVYRNEKVGYTHDGKSFVLAAHKKFLKEELVDIENLNVA